MRAVRGLVAGLVTLLLVGSAAVFAPAAAADPGEPVGYKVGCGFVELTSQSTDTVIVIYGDPRRKNEDGYFWFAPSAVKHIKTSRTQFFFGVLDTEFNIIQESPILRPQNCPKVTARTPGITGKTRVGGILTAKTTGWAPADVQLSYQWYRSGKKIAGATAGTYTLTRSDKGKRMTVRVTGAHDGYFSVAKTSKKTSKVKAGILVTARPTIEGSLVMGAALSANPGVWGPAGVDLAYQWYRGGKKISKAGKPLYTLVRADVGKKISVKVTGRLAGYTTVARTSVRTARILIVA